MNIEYPVNKKQLFSLLYKFMLENNIIRDWFQESMTYKLSKRYRLAFPEMRSIGKFDEKDNFRTHLEKCIEVYINSRNFREYYNGCIYGFFRHIPTSFEYPSGSNWSKISKKWEETYRHIKFVK